MEPVNTLTTQEKKKIYRDNNKDRIKEASKTYNDNHKEQKQQYYINNKDWICEIINCECGGKFQRQSKADHAKTIMHMNFINGITP